MCDHRYCSRSANLEFHHGFSAVGNTLTPLTWLVALRDIEKGEVSQEAAWQATHACCICVCMFILWICVLDPAYVVAPRDVEEGWLCVFV